jgi:PAS domain-containing protein
VFEPTPRKWRGIGEMPNSGTDEPPSFCPHTLLLQDGEEHSAEVCEERLEGDFLISVSPLRDASGDVVGSVHVARDVTNHNRAEQTLQESEERSRLMYERSPLGCPSTDTAILSVDMSVVAYLTKPLDFDELIPRMRAAIEQSRNRRALAAVRERLGSCLSELEAVESRPRLREDKADELVSIATIRTLASCLLKLLELASRSGTDWASQNVCELLDCPRRPAYCRAIVRTIHVLKETKDAFKSKALAELRSELEGIIGCAEGFRSQRQS